MANETHARDANDAARSETWARSAARGMRETYPGHYRALVDLRGDEETHSAETSGQIDKDLPRVGGAFRNALDLSEPGTKDWNALKRVLLAFVSHEPEIGYVQSMHSIAAFLLLAGLDEEDAFWCLVQLVGEIVPGYFSEGMTAAKLDQRVFMRILRERLPSVGLHVGALGPDDIIAAIMSGQWLLTLFVNVLPTRATMEVWDEMFRHRHRAPLFAACVALLERNAQAILATTEMGEAIELLQRCSESLRRAPASEGEGDACDEAECDAFLARVRELLSNELSPAKVDELTARVRGKFRRPSDVRLPAAITNVSALTDVDDLYVGLLSGDLRDKMTAAHENMCATENLKDELSMLKDASLASSVHDSDMNGEPVENESQRERHSSGDGNSPESILKTSELNSIFAKVVSIETHANALTEHGDEVLTCVKQIVLRPLRAILESRLKSFCEEIRFLQGEFATKVITLRNTMDQQLEMAPDLSVFLASQSYNRSMWPLWTESIFEVTIEQAEIVLESLEQIRAELAWMVSVLVGERKKSVAPKISRADGWEDLGEDTNAEASITAEPDEECLAASFQSHKNETENRLNEIRIMVKRTHTEAIEDLPRLRQNLSATTAKLKDELSAEEDAVNDWAANAESRNKIKQESTEKKLEQVSRELMKAYDKSHIAIDDALAASDSETGSVSAKDGLEQSHADEERRLRAALQSVKTLESVLSRRSNALEREKQTSQSVRAISSRTLSQTNASLLLVFEAGEWLEHELVARGSKDFVDDFERLADIIEELSASARNSCVRILREWSSFVRKITSQVVLEYVSIIDSSAQALSDTQAALAASTSRLDASSSLSTSPGSIRELNPSHASPMSGNSLRSLTSQMEKLTDIAGSKLGSFGNRLRSFASPTPSKASMNQNAPNDVETVSSTSPGNDASSTNSKFSRLAASAREDGARLESRKAQLLAKKRWLREHLVARGEA